MFLKQIRVMTKKVGGIVLSNSQAQTLGSHLDGVGDINVGRALSIVDCHTKHRKYRLTIVTLDPNSTPSLSDFTHPSPNPSDTKCQYLMIIPDAEWNPEATASAGGGESLGEVAKKEIRSWICQSTKGEIPEADHHENLPL